MRLGSPAEERGRDGHPRAPPDVPDHAEERRRVGKLPDRRTEARASICSGTKMHPIPIPWTRRGHARAQKSLLRLAIDISRVASPFMSTPKHQEPALIDAVHEPAHDDEHECLADSARRQDEARGPGVVAHELLREEGRQQHARVEPEAREGHRHRAEGEVPVREDGEVDKQLQDSQLADHEGRQRHHGHHGQRGDRRRVEPVLALAPIQDELQAPEPQHHEDETATSTRPGGFACAESNRSALAMKKPSTPMGEDVVEDQRHDQLSAIQPTVGPKVGEHDPEAPHRHGHAALLGRRRSPTGRPAPQGMIGPPPRPCRMRMAIRNSMRRRHRRRKRSSR